MLTQEFEQFGKYLLLEKLATGGMAEVFLARAGGASGIAKFFAIKRILPQYAESPEFIEMFKDEAKIAINLSHSNIVSIHEFGVQKNQFFLVMDYVEGRNLRQILNKMKKLSMQFSIDQIAFLTKEIAAGLDHAHRCLDGNTGKPLNITHRDMSPQNVMVSFEGEVKIVDFGIAKAESQIENTRAGTLKGKFGYMSPEQADGQPIDLRTDIFSLGIVLWEMLAHDRLFSANNELNTLRKIRDCQIPSLRKINPNIHAELDRIAQKALARDRNLRYQTAAAFHRDLNRFLNRQYPDFSPQDFSVFIKSIFAEDILSLRKRLMEYSKINFNTVEKPVDDRTVITDTLTNSLVTQTGPPAGFKNLKEITSPSIEKIDLSKSTSLPALRSIGTFLDEDSIHRESNRKIEVKVKLENQLSVERSDPSIRKPREARPARYSPARFEPPPPSKPSVRITTLALFVFVILGIYSYLIKYHTGVMMPVIRMAQPMLGKLHEALGVSGSAERASQDRIQPAVAPLQQPQAVTQPQSPTPTPEPARPAADGFIVISSQPSGAEIYVDNTNTGKTTPSRIQVPQGHPFMLALKRTGYATYTAQMSDQQFGAHFTATLQESRNGFVDIEVVPTKNVTLFVNGIQIKERQPYREVAVPAGPVVKLRVEDAQGNFDEKSIQLKYNQHRHILFNLHDRDSD